MECYCQLLIKWKLISYLDAHLKLSTSFAVFRALPAYRAFPKKYN